MHARRASAALVSFLLLASLIPAAASADPVLPPRIELPPWATGFFWTYHYEGADAQSFAGFTATYLDDTYTSSVLGATATLRGDAWIVRNSHAGSMAGYAPIGPTSVPATATFSSVTYLTIRKSDLATLNFTQDLDITANIQIIGNIHALAHNESYADPPLADPPIGIAADGTPWHVYSNITSTGWIQIEPAPRQNTTSYVVFDYNLSVRGTETITIPAGTFDAYNITGLGTMDFNGTVYDYTADYLWSPAAQAIVRDQAGFLLTSHFVNRPPRWVGATPFVQVDAGGYNDSLDLSTLLVDPEGSAITFSSCTADAPLSCTVSPSGAFNVSSPNDVNATLNATVVVSDGLPGGNFSARVRVLVRGPGNPNLPPRYLYPPEIDMMEDTDFLGTVFQMFEDPEGDPLTISLRPGAPLYLLEQNETHFRLRPPTNFFGDTSWTADAYDTAGNYVSGTSIVRVLPVNDIPYAFPVGSTILDVHAGGSLNLTIAYTDVDGGPFAAQTDWRIDSAPAFPWQYSTAFTLLYQPLEADVGNHTISASVFDGIDTSAPVDFSVRVWGGPTITATDPPFATFRIGNGTSYEMAVTATDPDSPDLTYRWSGDGELLGTGVGANALLLTFGSPGAHAVDVEVSDNLSTVAHHWDVIVEELPANVAGISSPAEGLVVLTNQTVRLAAFVHPGLTNTTFAWSIDGVLYDTSNESEIGTLAAGDHTISLRVTGVYNQTISYNVSFAVNVTSKTPAIEMGGNGTPIPRPPAGDSMLLWILVAIAGAGAVAAVVVLRARKQKGLEPPAPPEG